MFFCIALLLASLFSPYKAFASDKKKQISLTREKILELSSQNYLAVQEQHLQVQLDSAQLRYVEGQRKELGSFNKPVINKLPTTVEELKLLVPEYDNMTDEERQEIDGLLLIQAMINASMNNMIEAQANYQYTAGIQQWSNQLDTLDQEVDNGNYNVKMSKLEKTKLELAAQLSAVQSYYEIMKLQIDIHAAQYEVTLARTKIKDVERLYELGLSTRNEIDQAKQSLAQHEQNVIRLNMQVNEKQELFKQSLGIKKDELIILPDIKDMQPTYHTAAIEVNKQIDHIKAEETISHVKTRLEAARGDWLLIDYLNTLLVVEVERKEIIEQWLDQKILLINNEENIITMRIKELESQKAEQTIRLEDYKKLYFTGHVSARDHEAVGHDLARLNFTLEKEKLEYFIWQEKKRVAILGFIQ